MISVSDKSKSNILPQSIRSEDDDPQELHVAIIAGLYDLDCFCSEAHLHGARPVFVSFHHILAAAKATLFFLTTGAKPGSLWLLMRRSASSLPSWTPRGKLPVGAAECCRAACLVSVAGSCEIHSLDHTDLRAFAAAFRRACVGCVCLCAVLSISTESIMHQSIFFFLTLGCWMFIFYSASDYSSRSSSQSL